MKRGEVWWVQFGPSAGGEIQKLRPAIIISNDTVNQFLNRIQVIPLTSKIIRLYPSEAYVILNGKQNKAMTDQITTVSKLRLTKQAGQISDTDMEQVEQALLLQLDLKL